MFRTRVYIMCLAGHAKGHLDIPKNPWRYKTEGIPVLSNTGFVLELKLTQ